MSHIEETILIAGMVAVTYGARYPVLALVGRISLPAGLKQALNLVPPAVLAAIVAPAILMPNGSRIAITVGNGYLVAGLIAATIALLRHNVILTVLSGMVAFWVWRLLMLVV